MAELGLNDDPPVVGGALYHCQQALETEVLPAVKLTEFATLFRYPGELEQPTLEEAQGWLALARGVYEDVRRRLPEGARD
jgi:hypothetical protein